MKSEHLPAHKHKIFLMFNGVYTFVPFMKTKIASILNAGVSAMRQVVDAFTSVKEVLKVVINQTVLKNAVTKILGQASSSNKHRGQSIIHMW